MGRVFCNSADSSSGFNVAFLHDWSNLPKEHISFDVASWLFLANSSRLTNDSAKQEFAAANVRRSEQIGSWQNVVLIAGIPYPSSQSHPFFSSSQSPIPFNTCYAGYKQHKLILIILQFRKSYTLYFLPLCGLADCGNFLRVLRRQEDAKNCARTSVA